MYNTQFAVIVTYIRLLLFRWIKILITIIHIQDILYPSGIFVFFSSSGCFCWGIYLLYRSYKSDQANGCSYRLIAFWIFWFLWPYRLNPAFPYWGCHFRTQAISSLGRVFYGVSCQGCIHLCAAGQTRQSGVEGIYTGNDLGCDSLSLAAYARNMVWSDEVTLWEDAVRKSPTRLDALQLGLGLSGAGPSWWRCQGI